MVEYAVRSQTPHPKGWKTHLKRNGSVLGVTRVIHGQALFFFGSQVTYPLGCDYLLYPYISSLCFCFFLSFLYMQPEILVL